MGIKIPIALQNNKKMNNLLSLLFLLLITISSCEKSESLIPHPENYWGTASAELNGEKWSPVVRAANNNNYTKYYFDVIFEIYNSKGYLRQNFMLGHIKKKISIQQLQKGIPGINDTLVGAYFFKIIEDGDVVGDEYELIDTLNSNMIIRKMTHAKSWNILPENIIKNVNKNCIIH